MHPEATRLIAQLKLEPHPEGGFYRETWRAQEIPDSEGSPGAWPAGRPWSTSIYYMVTSEQTCRFHRLRSAETWYHHAGSALSLHVLDPQGGYRLVELGGENPRAADYQWTVDPGCWFGATVEDPDGFALVGCAMAPGFLFCDLELGTVEQLMNEFPGQEAIIRRLAGPS